MESTIVEVVRSLAIGWLFWFVFCRMRAPQSSGSAKKRLEQCTACGKWSPVK